MDQDNTDARLSSIPSRDDRMLQVFDMYHEKEEDAPAQQTLRNAWVLSLHRSTLAPLVSWQTRQSLRAKVIANRQDPIAAALPPYSGLRLLAQTGVARGLIASQDLSRTSLVPLRTCAQWPLLKITED